LKLIDRRYAGISRQCCHSFGVEQHHRAQKIEPGGGRWLPTSFESDVRCSMPIHMFRTSSDIVCHHSTTRAPHSNDTSRADLNNSTVSLANGPLIQIWTGEEPIPTGANAIGSTSQGYLIIEHLHVSSSTSSESSRSSITESSTVSCRQDGTASPPEAPRQDRGLSTRTIKFQEPKPCCPGI